MSEQTREGKHTLTVDDASSGSRLDAFIASQLSDISRSNAKQLMAADAIRINGALPRKAGQKVTEGDVVVVETVISPLDAPPVAQDIPIEIVYADDSLVIVNKAAGMVVHPAQGHPDGTLVNALLHHFPQMANLEGVGRPGIVHRLDKDTSGLLVVALNAVTHRGLKEQFEARTVDRHYLAVVHGPKLDDAGTISTLFGRHPRDRKKMTGQLTEGRQAITHWKVISRSEAFALVEVRLQTGRTHQIRVHLSESGHHVVGDPTYGRKTPQGGGGQLAIELAAARRMHRQALHAASLGFVHPVSNESMSFQAPLPPDMQHLVGIIFPETTGPEA